MLIIHIVTKILDVDICELLGFGPKLGLTLLARFEATDKPEGGERATDTHSFKTALSDLGNLKQFIAILLFIYFFIYTSKPAEDQEVTIPTTE